MEFRNCRIKKIFQSSNDEFANGVNSTVDDNRDRQFKGFSQREE